MDEWDLISLLGELIEKSLVVAEVQPDDAGGESEPRYRLLEPVRQFALEQLERQGEVAAVRRRHVDYFLALAEGFAPENAGRQFAEGLSILESEIDNLRAGIGWSLDQGNFEVACRFGMAMRMFWVVKGRHSEGRHWMDQTLERGSDLQPTMRARALYALACCIYGSGDNERLLAVSTESSELFRSAGDRYGDALGLGMIGFARILLGDLDHATTALQGGLAIFRSVDNPWASTHILNHLAPIARSRGDLALAARYDEEALALARQTGDVPGDLRHSLQHGTDGFRVGRSRAGSNIFHGGPGGGIPGQ